MNLPRLGVRNPVFANLVMWAIVVAGIYSWFDIVREMFPNFDSEQVVVTVVYPGATPDEMEKTVTLRLERELEDVDGIERVESEILESVTAVRLTLERGTNRIQAMADIRAEVDKVRPDLPEGAEDPEIVELRPYFPVIQIVLHGHVTERQLRAEAQRLRDDLLNLPQVSEVRLSGLREREILAEIRPELLEAHGLTFGEVGRSVAAGNVDLPGGQIESSEGNVRVRTLGEEDRALEIEDLVIRTGADGSATRLRDVAQVREGFEDKVESGRFQGRPAATLTVFKTPEEDAIAISDAVHAYVEANPSRVGGVLELSTITDLSRFIRQRLDLMIRNARMGFIAVVLSLALFLDTRTAFWVSTGLVISFLGTFVVMQWFGQSINLISLFALIVVLGMLVDDAIVIGENVFTKIRAGMPPARAAVEGATEVVKPVAAAVTTTIVAFVPLAFMVGDLGAFMKPMPLVVTAALGVSLLEAFLILPAHLAHSKPGRTVRFPRLAALRERWGESKHRVFEQWLPDLLERVLRPVLRWRYVSLAAAVSFSVAVIGLIAGGIIPFVLFQDMDAERLEIRLEMASGTPEERTVEVIGKIESALAGYEEVDHTFAVVGSSFNDRGRQSAADPATVGYLVVELLESDERQQRGLKTSSVLVNELRRATAAIPGVHTLSIGARAGGPTGADVEIRIRGEDVPTLERAVDHVREVVGSYGGVTEIEDDLREGKLEARLRLRDTARPLGLTTRELALQMRHALFGFEAQDLQEENDEVTVRVVLPPSARESLSDLERLRIATPTGGRVPLSEVARLDTERGYASLARVDGKRAITLRAEVDETVGNVNAITQDLLVQFADIGTRFPGVSLAFEGRKKQLGESVASLRIGFAVAMLSVYIILAVLFRSYVQPLLVMAAIPYALVGAILGHLVMGLPFGFLSLIGGVALVGIVVNDSLILVDFINRRRREGMRTEAAVTAGARSRLRAILLTSITTILGIFPLMLETSFQAQFLIPMAVSIAFGLAFATVLTLVLVPTLYMILEDTRANARWLLTGTWTRDLPYDPGA